VTDQDLALKNQDSALIGIGRKIGTFNLYTQAPIGDDAVGLIRDFIESVYDTVRDAEWVTASERAVYHADPFIAKWLRVVFEWIKVCREAEPWSHNAIDSKIAGRMRLLLGDDALTNEQAVMDAKRLFQWRIPGNLEEAHLPTAPVLRRFLGALSCSASIEVDHKWVPPVLPLAKFLLPLRFLLADMEATVSPRAISLWSRGKTFGLTISLDPGRGKGAQREYELASTGRKAFKGFPEALHLLRCARLKTRFDPAKITSKSYAREYLTMLESPRSLPLSIDWDESCLTLSWNEGAPWA
jgi:hypothetical protein